MSQLIPLLARCIRALLAQSQRHRSLKFWPSASKSRCSNASCSRPVLNSLERFLWITLYRDRSRWKDAPTIVMPDTVTGWHRAGSRLLLALAIPAHRGPATNHRRDPRRVSAPCCSKSRSGSAQDPRRVTKAGLRRLGAERSPGPRAVRVAWATLARSGLHFLQNHREAIVALDFFTVPTLTFQLLYCFFVIEHSRRKILDLQLTRHPTAEWVVQQRFQALPWPVSPGLLNISRGFSAGIPTSTSIFSFIPKPALPDPSCTAPATFGSEAPTSPRRDLHISAAARIGVLSRRAAEPCSNNGRSQCCGSTNRGISVHPRTIPWAPWPRRRSIIPRK